MAQTATKDKITQWYLRIDDGSVFGPVPEVDLVDWAADGRIAPGNELSADREQWMFGDKEMDV